MFGLAADRDVERPVGRRVGVVARDHGHRLLVGAELGRGRAGVRDGLLGHLDRARRDVVGERDRVGARRAARRRGRAALAAERAVGRDGGERGAALDRGGGRGDGVVVRRLGDVVGALAVDLIGVEAGGDAGRVGRERRGLGVAGLDAADLGPAVGRELERAAVGQVAGAHAGLVALLGAAELGAAAVDRAAAVVGLVGLARAVRAVVGDDLRLGAQRGRGVGAGVALAEEQVLALTRGDGE